MAEDQGASLSEQIMHACRTGNEDLLNNVLADLEENAPKGKEIEHSAKILNEARDGIGYGALHLAALKGHVEIVDTLLYQEGLEIDELDRMEGDTPLHKAVRYANSSESNWADGYKIVDLLIEAGCDPRIRNKGKLKPAELVDPKNKELSDRLKKGEFTIQAGDDVIVEDDDDDGPTGSGSESD